MNAITKRLLSFVTVLALVLSMAPAITLPAAAAEVDIAGTLADIAAWETANAGKFVGTSATASCPFCGEEEVTWKGGSGVTMNADNGTHYFLYKDETNTYTYSNQAVVNSSSALEKACLYLNNQNITIEGHMRVRGGEVNIFGNGTITKQATDKVASDGTKYADWAVLDVDDKAATVNIWGGNYISQQTIQASGNNPYGTPVIMVEKATYPDKIVNIYNGTFTVADGAEGPAIQATVGTVNLYGGTVSGGTGYTDGDNTYGGNVYVKDAAFNMYGGTISGGDATYGGNVYLSGSAMTMSGDADIYGGNATSYGGNVYVYGGSSLAMSGQAEIYGGEANHGGNVYLSNTTLTMADDAEIYDGTAARGGNLRINGSGKLVMDGDTKIYDGTCTTSEANIWAGGTAGSSAVSIILKGNSWINGAVDSDGNAVQKSAIGMSYGTLVLMDSASVYNDGAESIRLIQLSSATTSTDDVSLQPRLWIDNSWEGTAYVQIFESGNDVYGLGTLPTDRFACGVYDEENHTLQSGGSYTGSLFATTQSLPVVGENGVLTITEASEEEPDAPVVGVFDPAGHSGMAYCDACIAQGVAVEDALVEWTIYNGEYYNSTNCYPSGSAHAHFYLANDLTYTNGQYALYAKAKVCLNLNGKTIAPSDMTTAAKGDTAAISTTSTLCIIDTSAQETGEVIGTAGESTVDGAAIRLNWKSAKCYLYGGTYTRVNCGTDARPILWVGQGGGQFYLYDGAIIDATGLTSTKSATCVYLLGGGSGETLDTTQKAAFHMYGGQILGGTVTGSNYGGAIMIGADAIDHAEVNMYDGTISGGNARYGGNVSVRYGTFNMEGGTISGGDGIADASSTGGNVHIAATGTLNMSGDAQIVGVGDADTLVSTGGNIYCSGTINMSGDAQVYDGHATSQAGNVYLPSSSELNMTDNAEIYGGIADTRAGNVRAYTSNAETMPVITMDGNAKIYDGFSARLNDEGVLQSTNEHNIWLGTSKLIMKGDSVVQGYVKESGIAYKSAIGMSSSVLVLADNASIVNASGSSANIVGIGSNDTVIIESGWNGEAHIYEEGLAITDGVIGQFYCGTYDETTGIGSKDTSATGTFTGGLYVSSKNNPALGLNGDVILAAASVVTASGETIYTTMDEALANVGNGYILILGATEIALNGDTYVDFNGSDVTVSGTGALYAMDQSNDDYSGNGEWSVAEGVTIVRDVTNPITKARYINITKETTEGVEIGASCRLELKLTTVSLRAATGENAKNMGLYYKAQISSGTTLANVIETHGVVLSLVDMPGTNFQDEVNDKGVKQNGFTAIETKLDVNADNGYTVALNSGSVFGIMSNTATTAQDKANNAYWGELPIYANMYVEIDADGDGEYEYYMSDVDTDETNNVAWSLFDVLDTIDTRWAQYDATAQSKVTAFYTYWAQYGMDEWEAELPNIAG